MREGEDNCHLQKFGGYPLRFEDFLRFQDHPLGTTPTDQKNISALTAIDAIFLFNRFAGRRQFLHALFHLHFTIVRIFADISCGIMFIRSYDKHAFWLPGNASSGYSIITPSKTSKR